MVTVGMELLVNYLLSCTMNSTLATGLTGTATGLLPDDCYTVACGGGSISEVGWSLADGSGAVLASGGAPYSATVCSFSALMVVQIQ